jgi:hypothetical protein
MANRLYFVDDLGWLRNTKEFPNAGVDLVFLEPPKKNNVKPPARAVRTF